MSSTEDRLTTDSALSVAAGLALTFGFGLDFDNDTNNSVDDDHRGQ
ncbi:hypothetical protein [Psychrobacter sp. GW208-MNA-CIBAN-0184]